MTRPQPVPLRSLAILACLAAFGVPPASAQTSDSAPGPYQPPPPDPEGFDWIKLTSGEWLKGDLDRMRDGDLEFDSDELDDLNLDWDDIAELRIARVHTYILEDRSVVTGTAHITADEMTVRSGDDVHTFPRARLLGIVPGTPSELNYWSGKVSAGLAIRSGNTDSQEFSAQAHITREDAHTRTRFGYNGAIAELENVRNTNNHRGTTRFDYFLTRRLFLTPMAFEVFTDEFQNIGYRVRPGAGLGYQIVDRSRIDVDLSLEAGYQYTQFSSVVPGASPDEQTAVLSIGVDWESDLTAKLEWDGEYRSNLAVPDAGVSNQHALTTFSYDLFWNIDFDLTFVWDRVEQPIADENGVTPKKNDFRTTFGLGWDF